MIVPSFGVLAVETVAAPPEEPPALVAEVVVGWLEDVELVVELPPQPATKTASAVSDSAAKVMRDLSHWPAPDLMARTAGCNRRSVF